MPDLTLPFADTESNDESLFSITNTGKGGGVRAITKGPGAAAVFESDTGVGVVVICEHGTGVFSESHEDIGVTGDGKKGGVRGTSVTIGVKGECNLLSPAPANIGVWGDCPNSGSGTGVLGTSNGGIGVQGKSVGDSAMGFLGGRDPLFHGAVGVYGETLINGKRYFKLVITSDSSGTPEVGKGIEAVRYYRVADDGIYVRPGNDPWLGVFVSD